MAEVTIKLDSPIITTDKSISEITTDGLANTGEIALATDGIVGNVNGALRKYPNPIKTFYVEKFVANGVVKWGFEPKDVKTNDVVIIKTATENLMFTVAEATRIRATLCAFTKNGGTRIVFGQKIGGTLIGIERERVADEYTGITYEYSLSEDLLLTDVNPFTIGQDALKCVPSYYTKNIGGKSYLKLSYNKEYLLPIGASYKEYNCVFYFIVNHKGQQKLVVLNTYASNLDKPITMSLSFVDLGFSPSNLTIGKTTKQINGTADVSFSAEEIIDKFNGALIQNLTTASTEANIRKAFTDNGTVKFPTPGSIISKLDGGNRGIVVSLSEPDVTTLGRTITVYHGNDTYTIIVKSDFTKVLMPWSKVSPKRNVYTEDVKMLEPEYDEARIKDYLTPQVYRKYHIVYPVKPQTGDLVEEYHGDELRYVAIKVVRNKENPNEYTDILIPESGTANAYTRIVLKNDLTAIKSRNPYYILKTCKRAYDGDLLLALDTVKAETIENSILDAYSFSIEGRNTQLAAQLPEVGDLIETYGEVAPVCETFVEPRTFVQHTRWFAKGKLYEVTVNTALTRVPEDPKVIYDTTSGTLRDLYISAGAKYNEATGFYELNGLTDITEEQMRTIYEKTWGWWLHLPSLNGFGSALPRTNIPCPDYKIISYASNISLHSIFFGSGNDDNLEVVNLRALYTPTSFDEIKIVDFNWAFQGDKKIREVQGIINVNEARYKLNIGGNIETINIKGLKVDIRFYNSQRLSKESVLYMINNSEATSAITISLNKAVYDVMKDDADIIAALAEKTNITLVQNT